MDDSKFLPRDLLLGKTTKEYLLELERSVNEIDRVVDSSIQNNNILELKRYKKKLGKLITNIQHSLGISHKEVPNFDDIDKVSNVVMNINPIFQEIEDLLTSELYAYSMSFDGGRYVVGLTRNAKDYIVSKTALSKDVFDELESSNKFFIYDSVERELMTFKPDLIPVIFRKLLGDDSELDPFLLLQKLKFFFKNS